MALMIDCLDTVETFTNFPFNQTLGKAALSAFVYVQGDCPSHYPVPCVVVDVRWVGLRCGDIFVAVLWDDVAGPQARFF